MTVWLSGKCCRKPFNLIITDIHMPVMNSISFAQNVKVPVLAIRGIETAKQGIITNLIHPRFHLFFSPLHHL